jgi:anti-sigma-K factor RskA
MEAGAYVLGALAPADRSAYERHLGTCPACREDVAQLAGLPGLLGRLDTAVAIGLEGQPKAPPLLLDTLLNRAGTERQRARRRTLWRRTGAGLVAACLVILAGLGVGAVSASTATHPTVVAMSPVDNDEMLAALVGYWADPDGGTEISMSCVYSASGDGSSRAVRDRLDLWVFPRGGGPGSSIWSWDAGSGDRVTFWAETPLQPQQIGRMEIRRGGTVLLVYRAA